METVPHRTPGPIPDVTEYTVLLPDGTPSDPAALLTAHARVLAALSGETDGAPGDELRVTVTDSTLRLSHRTGAFDTEAAARIAGYHLTALADPDRRSLLSKEELRFQLEELAGPVRELPDRRVHELFEERVGKHPDAVAAVQGERRWTYAELNSRANQIGRALLARGLKAEGVVAVVMERDLDWMAAVLGVFKAAWVYLPVEPHFPAERVSRTLSRAGCELVVTERDSTGSLSMTTATTLFVDAAYAESHADDDLGIPVAADQLAYIYFTSGSTGEPKGAMCERSRLRQPRARQGRGPGVRRGRRGRADRAAVLRHLPVAAARRAGRRRADAGHRPGDRPGRAAVRGHRGPGAGQRAPGRAVVPRGRPRGVGTAAARTGRPALCVGDRRGGEAGAGAALVRHRARYPPRQRLRADRDLRRHQPRGHGPGAGWRPGPARAAGAQCARVRRRRGPGARAAGRAGRDRLLRGVRGARVRQRPRAHRGRLHGGPVPARRAALPQR